MVSDTVISWVAVAVLPQASVNVHVLVISAGQTPDGGESVPVTDPGVLQLSVYARDVIGGTSPTHCTETGGGTAANTGAVVSLVNVIVCEAVAGLLQLSATVHVLVIDLVQPDIVSGLSENVAVRPAVQLSVTLAVPNAALISAAVGLHSTAVEGVTVITGAIVSDTVISRVATEVLPQASVNVHVLVMMAGQAPEGGESVPVTDPGASQLSV